MLRYCVVCVNVTVLCGVCQCYGIVWRVSMLRYCVACVNVTVLYGVC